MLKWKHIEAAREVRLWIGQLIIPAVAVMLSFPETREWLKEKWNRAKWSRKIRREGL